MNSVFFQKRVDLSLNHFALDSQQECTFIPKGKPRCLGQNSDLYAVYTKLLQISYNDYKYLSSKELDNLSRNIYSLYTKIDKSKKPSPFFSFVIRVHNLFFRDEIKIYDYKEKLKILELSQRINQLAQSKQVSPSPSTEKTLEPDNRDPWAKKIVVPVKKNTGAALGQLSPSVVVPNHVLEDLQNGKNYPHLLDELKKNYKDDVQEEIVRLREAGIFTKNLEQILNNNLNIVEKSKGGYTDSVKFNREGIKAAIGKALEIKKYFKDDYFIISHSQDTRWAVVNYLIKELVRHRFSKAQNHHFKFLRLPSSQIPMSRFKSGHVHDHDADTRKALISCDGYLFNTEQAESSLYFLSNNSSVASYGGNEAVIRTADAIIREIYPSDSSKQSRLKAVVTRYIDEIGSKPWMGTLHIFCLPKRPALNGEYASLYRSHPYGVACNCSLKSKGDEKYILERFQNDDLSDLKCDGYRTPQYRIIAPNLKPEEVFIKTFTPLDQEKRHEIKRELRRVIDS